MPDSIPADGHAPLRKVTSSPVQRVLVVANQTATSPALITELRDRAECGPVVISTLPANRSHWLEHDLVNLARRHFDVPVRHVITDEEVVRAA